VRHGIHFISGLPRSGSTLLAAILRQNPRFYAAMTSPVGAMYMALEGAMSRRNETAVFINETQRRDLLQGLFSNYYRGVEADRLVFDTNRMWCAKLPALTQLFPQARTICCVRSVAWIMDSIERLVRKNAFELSGLFGFEPGNTVFTRVNRVASSDGLVGFALDALNTLRHLYTVLGEPHFEHDLDNVDYAADEFDMALGAPGLHTIRRKVEWVERQTVLPPEIFQRFENDAFWRRPDLNIRQVPIIRLD
jgi:sulfotransferase